MDTLKRMGSIRKSLRKASPKKTASPTATAATGPADEGGGGGSGGESNDVNKVYFTLTVNDATVQPITGFQVSQKDRIAVFCICFRQ